MESNFKTAALIVFDVILYVFCVELITNILYHCSYSEISCDMHECQTRLNMFLFVEGNKAKNRV